MDFKKVLIGALGTVENGTTFKRAEVHHHLVQLGYSDRTATNALTPSRKGSLAHTLLEVGAIEMHGPRGYRIIDNTKIDRPKVAQRPRVMMYQGKTRDGWQELGWASLDDYETNFKFCGHRYAVGCWNLKVYADGMAPKKANYWVQYRRGTLCGDDAAIMKAHRPLLYAGVMEEMKDLEEWEASN